MKVIIIGATSGIGRRMAEMYTAKGYRVGITGRRQEMLTEIKLQYPTLIETECFDVTGNENISKLESLISKLGGMDILVYSSGIGEPSKALDWQLDKLTTDTNVNGFIEICNRAFNYFIKKGDGRLVTISSVASHRGNSWAPAYSASKAFQSNYFEALRIKAWRMKKDIGITCIEPGFIETKMAKGDKLFMVMPLEKTCRRIIAAIEKKKRKSYLSIRWWLVAKILKHLPFFMLKRII